jgi:GDP-D-mannose 3',5'-epimerase
VDLVASIAGIAIEKKHVPGHQEVRGRDSNKTRLPQILGWELEISLEERLARTYAWIEEHMQARMADPRWMNAQGA